MTSASNNDEYHGCKYNYTLPTLRNRLGQSTIKIGVWLALYSAVMARVSCFFELVMTECFHICEFAIALDMVTFYTSSKRCSVIELHIFMQLN